MDQEHTDEVLGLDRAAQEELIWILVGVSTVGALIGLVARPRRILEWILPLGLAGGGLALLLTRRQTRIDAVEERVLAELADLDPLARAQVLKTIADHEIVQPIRQWRSRSAEDEPEEPVQTDED